MAEQTIEAGNSTAKQTPHSNQQPNGDTMTNDTSNPNPNPTNNHSTENTMKELFGTRIANALASANINTVKEVRECDNLTAIKGIKNKSEETILLVLSQLETEEQETEEEAALEYKPSPHSRATEKTVENKEIYAFQTLSGTQSVTAYHRVTKVPQSIVMPASWSPVNAAFLAKFGFVPISNQQKNATTVIEEGVTVSDFTKSMFPNQTPEQRKSWAKRLLALNRELTFGSPMARNTLVKLPSFGTANWTVTNYESAELFGQSTKNVARARAYSSVVNTAHSKEIVEVNHVAVMGIVFLSNQSELDKLNATLIDEEGRRIQEFRALHVYEDGVIAATRWNDGMHLMSDDLKKLFQAKLVQGRSFGKEGWEELAKKQLEVNKEGSLFYTIDKEFQNMVWNGSTENRAMLKHHKAYKQAQAMLATLSESSSQKEKQKVVLKFRLRLIQWFKEFVNSFNKTKAVNTFTKGIYLNAHKSELSLPPETIGIYPEDIKSKDGGEILELFMQALASYDYTGKVNQYIEHYLQVPLEGKYVFTLMETIKPSKTSWAISS